MTRIAVISSEKPYGFMGSQDGIILTEAPPHLPPNKRPQSCARFTMVIVGILLIALSLGFLILSAMFSHAVCPVASGPNSTDTVPFASNAQQPGPPISYQKRYDAWMNAPVPDDEGKTPFSFDDMYNSSLVPKSPQVQWVGNNEVTYLNEKLELVLHNVDDDAERVLMTNETFIKYRPNSYQLSPDRKYVLITYELVTEVQDPYSFGKHKVYDLDKQTLISFPNDDDKKDQIVMFNMWTPKGSGLTFVFDDDMYYQPDPYAKPERLTTSGATHKIRNGQSFWNYRGVLQSSVSMWWSPDMTFLAYGEFDSTDVVMSEHPVYAGRVYPAMFRHVYLKAGDPEHFSYSKIHIIDMTDKSRTRKTVVPPSEFKDKQHYFYKVLWKNEKEFAVGWTDRIQKRSIVEFCDVATLDCKRNHDMTVKNGWFRGPHLLMFIDGGDSYLSVLAKEITGKGRIRQVAMVSSKDGKVTYLTDSDNEVISINAYDSEKHLIFFTGNNKNQLQQHVFRVGTPDAEANLRDPVCLTCDEGESCGSASASFSLTTDYYILACLGPSVPYYHLRWTNDLTKSYTILDNAAVKDHLALRKLPTREFHEVDVGDGYTGWAEFILPPGMVRDGTVKYPVMFYPYAGPHGHTQGNYNYKARSSAGGMWDYFLASSENIIVVRLNGRGSGNRGDDYLFQLYRKLGTYEITDQIDGAKSISEKFSFVDGDRMAIWGWSYGGYTSSHAIGHPSEVFKCGIAVAPVINYRHYYAAYTERYMDLDTTEDNAYGYNLTDVTRKVENFRNKKYMIAHGSLDDNVHFQMAMEMINALTNAQLPFKSQVYVDQNHGIRDFLQNRHLFLTMTDFYLNDCLGKQQ